MKGKKSFTAYCDWIETFEALPDEEAGRLIKHVLRYVNDQDPEPPSVLIQAVFANIKATLKRDLEKWKAKAEISRINGAKGGRPKTQENPKKPSGLFKNPDKPTERRKSKGKGKSKSKEERKAEFKKLLSPFKEVYGIDMLKHFFEYWTEAGPNDRKLRFEKEKSFSLDRRLSTWHKNELDWKKQANPKQSEFQYDKL